MNFFKNILKQNKNTNIISNTSVYFYDIEPLNETKIEKATADGLKIYELGYRCGNNKTIHDYDYLVFRPTSYVHDKDELKEIDSAVKRGAKIIIICGNIWHPSTSRLPLYYFFEHLKRQFKFDFDRCSNMGREVGHINEPHIKKWWDFVNAYSFYFDNLPEGAKVLAQDKSRHPIAWQFKNFIFIPSYLGCVWDCIGWKEDRERLKFIKGIIDFINEYEKANQEPAWLKEITLTEEKKDLNEAEIIKSRMNHYKHIKKILHTSGKELEDAFAYTLKDLKIEFEPSVGTSDGIIPITPRIIVEITGIKKNLKKEKVGQLRSTEIELKKKGIEYKKCLFINHERETNPKNRKRLDDYNLDLYKKEGISVLTSEKLLYYYEEIKNKRMKKEDFLKKLLETDGEV